MSFAEIGSLTVILFSTWKPHWISTDIFHTSWPTFVKFGREVIHITSLISCEFLENRRSEHNAVLYLQTQMNFYIYCPDVLSDLDEIRYKRLHVMLLSVYEFRGNLRRENRVFLMNVSEITLTRVHRETVRCFEVKNALLNQCTTSRSAPFTVLLN